jgi:hypothetical protein
MDHPVINLSVYFILFYYFMYSFGSARQIVPKKKIIEQFPLGTCNGGHLQGFP